MSNSIHCKVSAKETRSAIEFESEDSLEYGIDYFDDATLGIMKNDLTIISAYSGIGKTSLASDIAFHNCSRGKSVYYFALEAGRREIDIRMSYKFAVKKYFEDKDRKTIKDIRYSLYKRNKIDKEFLKYAIAGEEEAEKKLKNLTIIYRGSGNYTVQDFANEFKKIDILADLIIVDHLNYFDSDIQKEYSILSESIKTIRDRVLIHNIPIIVVSHLNRPDRKIKRLVPDQNDLHGSSNIGKVATTILFLTRDYNVNPTNPNHVCSYLRVGKHRDDGSLEFYAGRKIYDVSTNEYLPNYSLVRLKEFDTKFEIVKLEKIPWWVKHADFTVYPKEGETIC